jgi:DNA-directed RNA polymerase subunit RPC12/RpoP
MSDIPCPICSADIPLDGDEKDGQTVYCTYCSTPLMVRKQYEDSPITLIEDT